MSEPQNTLLADIASAIGLADDFSNSPRNSILYEIAVAYGGVITTETQNDLLRAIDEAINGSSATKPRNKYLKAIAEGLGAVGLTDGLSRNTLLESWLANAVPVVNTWILFSGTWNDLGKWDDSATWNDGV